MNIINSEAYRVAFSEFLRKGTPIRLGNKEQRVSEFYVWRTRGDEKVRLEHRRNNGRLFRWTDELPTGHPGEDYNCRCVAVPYVPGKTEYAYHEFSTSLASSYDRWTDVDFVRHYYFGNGRAVTLLEIGHLREIAEQYAYKDGAEGAFRRLSGQIASKARQEGPGAFTYDFNYFYDFGDVAFSHGDGSVSGVFSGVAEGRGAILAVQGESTFRFSDEFADPLGLGVEPGGTPYAITGDWTASFSAEVFKDEARSDFFHKESN